ncbi:hypothetical protein C2S53_009522, partial [Perilla frutescens var. hirtella]
METGKLKCKQKHRFIDKEMISQLVLMLHAQDNESIEAALFALLNLAFGSERNKVRIAKCGAIPALLEILQWRKESLVELAVATLLVLSSCTANKPEIGSSGAVQMLFQLLDSQFAIGQCISHQAKLDIISTLHNLSTSPQTLIRSIVISDCLIPLIQLICAFDKSSELVEKAIGLLESLVSASDIVLNQVSEMGGVIGMLVEAVEEGTGPCKEHAAGVLVLICKRSKERYRVMILSEGAMPGILQLSVHGTTRARDNAKALLLLLRDTSKSNHSRNLLLEEMMREIDRVGTS